MSDSVPPHRQEAPRLPRPWDSPGKNTGVDCHFLLQHMKVKSESEVTQSCLTVSDPMDCSPRNALNHPKPSPGILRDRILPPTWLSGFSSVQSFSHVWLFVTLWTAAHQAPLSLGFSRQEYWSWLPFPLSHAWKWKVKVKSLSRVRLLATPWTAAHQAPPSMGFARQEYWSGVPLPSSTAISSR